MAVHPHSLVYGRTVGEVNVPILVDDAGVVATSATLGDVTISGADGAITDGAAPSIKATVIDLASSNPLATAIVDASGNQITSFGGGTQYTEDAAAAANPVGNALILVREDAWAGSLVTTDGDNVAARGNNKGELYVKHTDSIVATTEQTLDYDTGAGTATVSLRGIALPASGGPVAGGTNTNPIQIGDAGGSLTVDNGGTFAVQAAEADGANVTLGAKADAKSTATDTTAVSAMSVLKQISASVQAPPSQAVTNAGTFAVQSTNNKTIKSLSGSFTSDTDIIAAVTSKRIKVLGYAFFTFGTSATTLLLKSNGTGGTLLWTILLQAVSPTVFGANLTTALPGFIFGTAAGEKLTADTNTSDTIYWSISYYDDDAT